MQMSSMNSLVEVGVGINLAFGAFKGMRDGLYNYFVNSLETNDFITQAQVNEGVNGGIRAGIADINQNIRIIYSEQSEFYNKIMVVIALLCASLLLVFLVISSIYPNSLISDKMVYPCLAVVVGPLLIAAITQLFLYTSAERTKTQKLLPYKHYLLVSELINPTPPTP